MKDIETAYRGLKLHPMRTLLGLAASALIIAFTAWTNGCFGEMGRKAAGQERFPSGNNAGPSIINQQIVNFDNARGSPPAAQDTTSITREQSADIDRILTELKAGLQSVRDTEAILQKHISEIQGARTLTRDQASNEINRITRDISQSHPWVMDFFSTNRLMRKIAIEKSIQDKEEKRKAKALQDIANKDIANRSADMFLDTLAVMLIRYEDEATDKPSYRLPTTPIDKSSFPISFDIRFGPFRAWIITIDEGSQKDSTPYIRISIKYRSDRALNIDIAPVQGVCQVLADGDINVVYFKREYPIANTEDAIKDALRSLFDADIILGKQY